MQYKYCVHHRRTNGTRGPYKIDPNRWISGPDPVMREVYYAWRKHRSQAIYRKEEYHLTYEDWLKIWHNLEDFFDRGRDNDSLVLTRKDWDGPWVLDNCELVTRYEQLLRSNQRITARRRQRQEKKRNGNTKI